MILKTLTFKEEMIFFFFKMDEAWPNAPNLETDAWYLEILFLFFFFFFLFLKMNEAWLNAPSLQIDAWLLKTLIFEEKLISFSFFQNEWVMVECP